ncbi:MAG: glucosaminidase domain-containing protein [Bacteroidales bacterium]|nr:glucosaminidase domain-containing protein [Bacteroidales bacterium]
MKRIWFILICITVFTSVSAQNKNTVTEDYITRYRDIAINNEKEYKIPACITLAQGIIESGSGRSTLAKESNNHFGIKCHSDWQGKRMYKDDDKKDDCFRVYDSPEESFSDHSIFLTKGKRYAFLFDLSIDDYKGWANGLKKAGYATNPKYPELLIGVIEVYDLQNVTSDSYYLVKDLASNDAEITPVDKNITPNDVKVEDKEPVKHKKSLVERLFGNTKWYQRRHETFEQRKRREMDEKIQRMIDEKDVKRTDFEIEFE